MEQEFAQGILKLFSCLTKIGFTSLYSETFYHMYAHKTIHLPSQIGFVPLLNYKWSGWFELHIEERSYKLHLEMWSLKFLSGLT